MSTQKVNEKGKINGEINYINVAVCKENEKM